ncbi:MAG: hypothetical protein OHK0012_14870 [Synechococcales cyanobacterium]
MPNQTYTAATSLPVSDYVTDLQLHMTLQARHLLPSFDANADSDHRLSFLQRTQADVETLTSRCWL